MPKHSHLDNIAKDRYTELRKSERILPFQNKIKRDKLIINGSIRDTFHAEEAPFCIWRTDYDPNLDPVSWESIQKRRASFDHLMKGGQNNENKLKKKFKPDEPYKRRQ